MSDFQTAFDYLLRWEGGFVDDPVDPGGATKYGISQRFLDNKYPDLRAADLTEDDAELIYRNRWDRYEYEKILDQGLANRVFALSVNAGALVAGRALQRALRSLGHGLVEDGIVGPKTLERANAAHSAPLIAAWRSEAAGYYRQLLAEGKQLEKYAYALKADLPPTEWRRVQMKIGRRKYADGWLGRAYD